MGNELAALANEETVEEAAEDALVAAMSNKEIMEPSEELLESVEGKECQKEEIQEKQVESDDNNDADESDDEVTWELQSGDHFYMCEGSAGVSCSDPAPPEGVKAPSGTFKELPAFVFLEQFGLTDIPNVQECGNRSSYHHQLLANPLPIARKEVNSQIMGAIEEGLCLAMYGFVALLAVGLVSASCFAS